MNYIRFFLGFTSSCLLQPVQVNEICDDADVESLLLDDERARKFKRIVFESKRIQDNLKNLLPIYDRLGLFD